MGGDDAAQGAAPSPPTLLEQRHGATLVLTLNQPARRNAMSLDMRLGLVEALERAEADRELRAIVLTGAEGQFCAGSDISGMVVADLTAGRERMALNHRLVRLLVKGAKPVIAAVEGWCVGAGLSLAAASDLVVAADNARFMAGFARIGLIPDLGALHTLPLRVGQGPARRMLLSNAAMDAGTAERIGLVDQLVPAGNALARAIEQAEKIAESGPLPLALTRQFLASGLDAALDWEREIQAGLFMTGDHAEGKAAFAAKRPPRFQGA